MYARHTRVPGAFELIQNPAWEKWVREERSGEREGRRVVCGGGGGGV